MQRVDAREILDSNVCSAKESEAVLKVLGRINRWFGGVSTSQRMVERAAKMTGIRHFSMLEVAAGLGEVPGIVQQRLAQQGIHLEIKLLDMAQSHLPANHSNGKPNQHNSCLVVGDALALPFADDAFDLVSCNLFTHHLDPNKLKLFMREALRVSRHAVLINDLVRHRLHLALVYASFPVMLNRVAWLDGLTSVRRAYQLNEIREGFASTLCSETLERAEISRHFLYRMGVILWKKQSLELDAAGTL